MGNFCCQPVLKPGQMDQQVVASGCKLNLHETCIGWRNRLASFLPSTHKSHKKMLRHDIYSVIISKVSADFLTGL